MRKGLCLRVFILEFIGIILLNIQGIAFIQKIQVVGDVKVIENKKKPVLLKGTPSKLLLQKELTIGEKDDTGSYFAQVAGFDIADDGRIFVLDFKEKNVKMFDSSGKFHGAFGKEGQGPGEWNMPTGFQLTPQRELMIEDSGNRKLIFFTLDSQFLREVSYSKKLSLINILMDKQGNFLGRELSFAENQIHLDIIKYDTKFEPLFKIDRLSMPSPFSGKKINPFEITSVYQFDNRSNIIYGRNDEYKIKFYTPEGKLFKIVQKKYDPVRITQDDKEEMIKKIPETPGINIKENLVFPKNYPPFSYIFLDEDNRLFVRTYEKGTEKVAYILDVFDSEGRFISRCESYGLSFKWKGSKLYTLEENEEGYHLLCRYEATWEK